MAQCSVLCDLSFDMLDIATFGLIITVRQLWTEKLCTGIKMIVSYTTGIKVHVFTIQNKF